MGGSESKPNDQQFVEALLKFYTKEEIASMDDPSQALKLRIVLRENFSSPRDKDAIREVIKILNGKIEKESNQEFFVVVNKDRTNIGEAIKLPFVKLIEKVLPPLPPKPAEKNNNANNIKPVNKPK